MTPTPADDALPRLLGTSMLGGLPATVRRPTYDPARLQVGILHLGLGAFHRAHQAVYTEDAIAAAGGDWGILAVSLRRPDTPRLLRAQSGIYTVETLYDPAAARGETAYRIIGCLRGAATAPLEPTVVLSAFAAAATQIVSLTVTEKGYTLAADGTLDLDHPDIAHDLRGGQPVSTIGWLVAGFAARRNSGARGMTVLSCDNLTTNGAKLRGAVMAFADACAPALARWIGAEIRFPNTMVDCIVPATDDATRARVAEAIGCVDKACVQREPFAQWVIEDDFAAARPAWDAAGVTFVADVTPYQQLKLHVLNLPHSALAYFGLLRGLTYCREAITDTSIAAFADALISKEVAPALPHLAVNDYWHTARARIANPRIDHAARQVGEDGSIKLAQRALPLLIANARAGRPTARLAALVHAWITCAARGMIKDPQSAHLQSWSRAGGTLADLLADPNIFPNEFRTDPIVRMAIGQPHTFLTQTLRGSNA